MYVFIVDHPGQWGGGGGGGGRGGRGYKWSHSLCQEGSLLLPSTLITFIIWYRMALYFVCTLTLLKEIQ